ncbi:MAG: hypothetical protein RL112_14 [Planctomycetota bacterium]
MRTMLLALLLIFAPNLATAVQAPAPEEAVVELDGVRIAPDAYATWLLRTHGERLARVYGAEQVAVERAARAVGVELSEEELAASVQRDFEERIQHAFFGNLDEWRAEFARTGRTEAGARRQREVEARPFMLAGKMASIGRVVPEHKIVREWERLHGRLGRRYELSMSFYLAEVASPKLSGAEARKAAQEEAWSKAKSRALAARARIASGEDFGKVARETSEDPDTKDGRGVPSSFRDEGWPKGFHEELAKLAVGELSQPLQGKGGWWLVKVREVKATPLEAARPAIVAMLREKGPEPDEVGAILEPIHANTRVEVLPQMWQAPDKGEQGGGDLPVMLVDGEPVGRADYARFLLYWQGETALTRFVEDWAVERKAAVAGVSVTDEEVRARVDEHIEAMIDEGFKRQREGWLAFLRRANRTEESFRASLSERWRIDLMAEKLMLKERVVDERAIRERYVAAYGAEGERFEVAWIVRRIKGSMPAGEPSREAVEAELARASEVARVELAALLARAKAGEAFADLAREASEDLATRDEGGRRPGRFRADSVPQALADAVLAQPVGGATGPLQYGSAWVAFQVLERRKVSFEEAKAELAEELRVARPFLTDIGSYRNTLAREVQVRILPGMAR